MRGLVRSVSKAALALGAAVALASILLGAVGAYRYLTYPPCNDAPQTKLVWATMVEPETNRIAYAASDSLVELTVSGPLCRTVLKGQKIRVRVTLGEIEHAVADCGHSQRSIPTIARPGFRLPTSAQACI